MPGGRARRGIRRLRGLSRAWARCTGRVAGVSCRSSGVYLPVPLRAPAALEGVHAYPGGCPGLSAKGAGAPRRPSRAPRKPSRGPFAATAACRAEWAGLSASSSRGCRRQGPGMPRIGGVYARGWRGAKFWGSRVPHSCSRAPRGMGGGAGVAVGRAFAQGGRACGEVGWAAGAVASASGGVRACRAHRPGRRGRWRGWRGARPGAAPGRRHGRRTPAAHATIAPAPRRPGCFPFRARILQGPPLETAKAAETRPYG